MNKYPYLLIKQHNKTQSSRHPDRTLRHDAKTYIRIGDLFFWKPNKRLSLELGLSLPLEPNVKVGGKIYGEKASTIEIALAQAAARAEN